MKRTFLIPLSLVAALLAPATARADDTSPPPVFLPTPLQLTLPPFGEPTSTTAGLAPSLAVLPLRLSLFSSAFPLAATMPFDPFGCASHMDPAGNSTSGFATQSHVFLPITSRLAFHAFSRQGCPLDALTGGAFTYTLPIARNVWLVPSAGVYTTSSALGLAPGPRGDARVDLVFKTYTDHALGVGVGRQGIKLTGTW
jgi:hypothetical protein